MTSLDNFTSRAVNSLGQLTFKLQITMAQQDNGPCWDSLPSVIMLEIFSYLEHKDRINASGVSIMYVHMHIYYNYVHI